MQKTIREMTRIICYVLIGLSLCNSSLAQEQHVVIIKKGILPLLGSATVYKNDSILIGKLLRRDMLLHINRDNGMNLKTGNAKKSRVNINKEPNIVFVRIRYNYIAGYFIGAYSMKILSTEEFKELYAKKKWVRRMSDELKVSSIIASSTK